MVEEFISFPLDFVDTPSATVVSSSCYIVPLWNVVQEVGIIRTLWSLKFVLARELESFDIRQGFIYEQFSCLTAVLRNISGAMLIWGQVAGLWFTYIHTHCTIYDTFLTLQLNLIPYSQNEGCFGWLGRGVNVKVQKHGPYRDEGLCFLSSPKKDAEPIHL